MVTAPARGVAVRAPSPPVRGVLVAFCVLTAAGFTSLFVLAPGTDATFAWTIAPPLTAAFLGAGYGAGFVLSALSLRRGAWSDVRVPYLAVLVFTWVTAVATALHLERMHYTTPGTGPLAEPAAWLWSGVYVAVPLVMAALLVPQERAGGGDPPVRVPSPAWVRVALGVQGAVLLAVGGVLFVAPASEAQLWPWALTPLTARVVAAWLLAIGLALALAARGSDLARLRTSAIAYAALGALQLLALARFGDQLRWGTGAAWGYLAGLVVVTATGAAGWWLTRPAAGAR